MYKTALLILILFCVSCGQTAQKKQPEETTEEKSTEITFAEPVFNFGQLKAGEIVIHSFVFENTGNGDFRGDNLLSDCGCITARFNKKIVKPGEKGVIEVEFNSAGLVGREYKTIEVHGNCKELKHLAIFAEVKNELIDIKY